MGSQLLMEGVKGAFFPEIGYVRQDDKVLVFFGRDKISESTNLQESIGSGLTLVESIDDLDTYEAPSKIEEGKTTKVVKDGRYFVEGPYQRSDVKNANGRVYPRKIWEKLVGDPNSPVQKNIRERAMLGHLEHPSDGRTDLNKGAIVTTNLKLRNDGVVWGESEILDTAEGLRLQEYTRKNVRWGVSSRGNGEVQSNGMVKEDFMLTTFDAVATPSVQGAYPRTSVTAGGSAPAKTQEGAADPPSPAAPPVVSESVKALISEAEQVLLDVHADLDESSAPSAVKQISDLLGRTSEYAKVGLIDSTKMADINKWLSGSLLRIAQGLPTFKKPEGVSEDEIDERLSEAVESVRVSYQSKIDALVEEIEGLKAEHNDDPSDLEEKLESALERARIAEQELSDSQRRLEIANSVIADRTSHDIGNPIQKAVDEAIKQVPQLAAFRETLGEAKTVDQVEQIAESLLPQALARDTRESTTVKPTERRSLPRGKVESGSDVKPVSESVSSPHGVKVAGAALRQMGAKG